MTSSAAMGEGASDGDDAPLRDAELRELLGRARAHDDRRVVQLITSYVTLRRVMADVIASIEAREGGAAVARTPLLLRARELSGSLDRKHSTLSHTPDES
jgi:hypothetical protein